MVPNTDEQNNSEISKNQHRFLSFCDFLIIFVIVVDVLYFAELLVASPGTMMLINIVSVFVSYIGYELKKRIRKINRRKRKIMDESTSQEALH